MGMEKEWGELKKHILKLRAIECDKPARWTDYNDIYTKMVELERRNLPEKVAEILRNTDVNKQFCFQVDLTTVTYARYRVVQDVFDKLGKALTTGDLSEIQKWVK